MTRFQRANTHYWRIDELNNTHLHKLQSMNERLSLYKELSDYDKADPLFCNAVETAVSHSVTYTHTR